MRITKSKCKICRRLGTKLFLKGERCTSPKCAIVKKPYPPGKKGGRGRGSDYKKELREKQKIKYWYNLSEKQFKNYVRQAIENQGKVEDTSEFLIQNLEKRLDNVIFRLGFAVSRVQARQLVSHGHFLVNQEKVNIPSYQVQVEDTVSIAQSSQKKKVFDNLKFRLKKKVEKSEIPSWLDLNLNQFKARVVGQPSLEQAAPPGDVLSVFEFYSR